ncbi:MAG: RNA 2',3'-cyclic phosphodiesterase [Chloroflexota bacterium]
MRLFIALELPAKVRDELGRQQADLRALVAQQNLPAGSSLKWTAPEGIHLTLKFLGEVTEKSVATLVEAMAAACARRAPLALTLAGRGAFPNALRPRILWVGIGGEVAALEQLQKAVDLQVGKLGFFPEDRPFSPHLTLARVRQQASAEERQSVAALLSQAQPPAPLAFVARQVNLFRSELRPTGASYTALATATL